jgi:hypothetical protein
VSLTPDPALVESSSLAEPPKPGWRGKFSSVLFAIFCTELGFFLLLYPWTDAWFNNRFSAFAAETYWSVTVAEWWRGVWPNAYFRGAVSGLGLVNLWIAAAELWGLRRFSRPKGDYNGQ